MSNILIIGAQNRFRTALMERLKREGHRMYILSPGKESVLHKDVKIYRHPYIHPSNREVYFSSRPDIVIFMGAYDSHYDWSPKVAQKTTQQFTADLNNLLFQANEAGVRQFIYLSSEVVFDESSLSAQPEDKVPSPNTAKGAAVLLGETLLIHYAQHTLMDTVTLRLDGVYYEADNSLQCSSTLLRMIHDALRTGEIPLDTKLTHSAMYVGDAVQAIFQLMMAPSHAQRLYHVSSGEAFTEDRMAEMIIKNAPRTLHARDNTVGISRVQVLYGHAFEEEFGFHARCRMEEYGPTVVQYVMRNSVRFLQSTDEEDEKKESKYHRFFRMLYPFLESTICFVIVLFIQYFTKDNPLFEKIDFFILYVFAFAMIHGFFQSIYTSVLSTIGFFLLNSDSSNLLTLMLDGKSYLWLAQLFILGMSVGTLRDKIHQNDEKWQEETDYLKDQLEDITTINESNVELKDYFEQRDINNRESLNYFYSIIRRLEEAQDDEMMFIAIQVLVETMQTRDAAFYSVGTGGFCRLKTSTSTHAMSLGKSIRITDYPDIFQQLQNGRIYVNRALEKSLPSMVVSMQDENNNLQYIILLWDMPYELMTQHAINTLRLLSLIIYNYINRTMRYLAAVAYNRYYNGTRILREAAFRSLFTTYSKAAKQGLSSLSVLYIQNAPSDVNAAQAMLGSMFRQDDILGLIDGRIYVLLPNTDRSEAVMVINRLAQRGVIAHYLLEPPAARADGSSQENAPLMEVPLSAVLPAEAPEAPVAPVAPATPEVSVAQVVPVIPVAPDAPVVAEEAAASHDHAADATAPEAVPAKKPEAPAVVKVEPTAAPKRVVVPFPPMHAEPAASTSPMPVKQKRPAPKAAAHPSTTRHTHSSTEASSSDEELPEQINVQKLDIEPASEAATEVAASTTSTIEAAPTPEITAIPVSTLAHADTPVKPSGKQGKKAHKADDSKKHAKDKSKGKKSSKKKSGKKKDTLPLLPETHRAKIVRLPLPADAPHAHLSKATGSKRKKDKKTKKSKHA